MCSYIEKQTRAPPIIHPNLLHMHKQIFEKGAYNSVRERTNRKPSLYSQLRTMDDNPRRFQDHPMKTVADVVFTRIC